MKNATDCAKNLRALLKRTGKIAAPDGPYTTEEPLDVLVHSFMMWESTTSRADKAWLTLREAFVDANELRVALPYEVVAVIGTTYPNALERCQRMRATLTNIFKNEHKVSLERAQSLGKRDARAYLDGLEGMTPYVAARTGLIAFDAHGIPVDEQLRTLLLAENAADESADVVELSAWLSRQIKADKGLASHHAFQELVDKAAARTPRKKSTSRKKSTRKKSTSMSSKKKTTTSRTRTKAR